jgi:hypothetical protein
VGFNPTSLTAVTPEFLTQNLSAVCPLKNSKLGSSPPAIALKYLISLPSTTTIPHSKLEGQIKGVGPTVFH